MLSGATSWKTCLQQCLHCCRMYCGPFCHNSCAAAAARAATAVGPALVAKAAPFLAHLHYSPVYMISSQGLSKGAQQHGTAQRRSASASHARQLTAALLPCSTVEHPPLFTTTSVASNTCGGGHTGRQPFGWQQRRKCRRRPAGARRQLLVVLVGKHGHGQPNISN